MIFSKATEEAAPALHRGVPTGRAEPLLLLLLLIAFIAINAATAARAPIVWNDEVMFTDPAAHAAAGDGFVSTAWPFQRVEERWAGNAPLHTWILAGWIKVWGLDVTAVRSVNFVYAAGAAALLWLAVKRSGVLATPWARLGLVAMVLCDYGTSFSYRSGRYDMLGMLWISAAAASMTVERASLRRVLLAAACAMLPATGLQLVPYALVGLFVIFVFWRRRLLGEIVAAAIGLFVGSVALWSVLTAMGAWQGLWRWITAVSADHSTATARVWETIRGYLDPRPEFASDYSLLPLVLVAAGWLFLWRKRAAGNVRLALALLTGVAAVPVALAAAGQFPRYYSWMIALPAALAAFIAMESTLGSGRRAAGAIMCAAVALAAAAGLPARIAVVTLEWKQRDAYAMERFVTSQISERDVVLADGQAFYALHRVRATAYYPPYLPQMKAEEKARVSVILAAPGDAERLKASIGGEWGAPAARFGTDDPATGRRSYGLVLFRRERH